MRIQHPFVPAYWPHYPFGYPDGYPFDSRCHLQEDGPVWHLMWELNESTYFAVIKPDASLVITLAMLR